MPTVDNNGVRIHYEIWGDGEPLVLIHGWSSGARYWDELGCVARLKDEFKLIVPDLRGHGDSSTPGNRDFSDAAFASDVIAVLDDLGIGSAHMFGYSLGGWVVIELAAAHPSRVRSAIVGGAHPYAEDLSPVRAFTPSALLDLWKSMNVPLTDKTLTRLAAFDPQLLASMIPDRVDQADRLVHLQVPCLMICGTADWRFDEMQRFANGNARCKFVALDNLDHFSAFLDPDRLLAPVRDFIRAQVSEGAV